MAAEDFKTYIKQWTESVNKQMKGHEPTEKELDDSDLVWHKMDSDERNTLHEFTRAIIAWNKFNEKPDKPDSYNIG